MKGFFYFPTNIDIFPDSSIVRKNRHIVSSANRLGVETDVINFSAEGILFNGQVLKRTTNNKVARGLSTYIFAFNFVRKNFDFGQYDFAWIRAGLCLPPQLSLIKEIRRQNPNIKLILEYGSFPFRGELFGYQKLLFPISERYSRQLKGYVSYVVTYCGQDEIYGIPSIKIGNGIDVKEIEWNVEPPRLTNALHIVSVSSLMYWHACDRVIAGMKKYYKNDQGIDVVFHVVGDSSERVKLEKAVSLAKLDSKVKFHGFKTKRELDEILDECHLAIGTLGMHRKGLTADSSLKNREYFAKGLPFVLATNDTDFPPSSPFIKYVPANEDPIDIDSLIEFYENMRASYPNYPTLIREYAEENLTWESKIKYVLDSIR